MDKKIPLREYLPEIDKNNINRENISRRLNSDGRQLFIRIPQKVSRELDLKNRQEVLMEVDYKDKKLILSFTNKIFEKTKKKSNIVKTKTKNKYGSKKK